MRRCIAIVMLLALCLTLSSCMKPETYFGFNKKDFTVLEEEDTHGGFVGDGTYCLILDCSENAEKARQMVDSWKALPLSHNLQLAMYDRNLAEEAHWPVIENGVYKFEDRHSESENSSDDSELFDRYSYNFSVAIYDYDTDRLYYFELDT